MAAALLTTAILIAAGLMLCVCKSQGFRFSLSAKRRMARKRRATAKKNEERSAVDPEERREAAGENVKPDRLTGRDLPVAGDNPRRVASLPETMEGIEDNGDVTEKQASFIRSLIEEEQINDVPITKADLEKYGSSVGDKQRLLREAAMVNLAKRPRDKREASELISTLKSGPLEFARKDQEGGAELQRKFFAKYGDDLSGFNKAANDAYDKLSDEQREIIFSQRGTAAANKVWREYVVYPMLKF